MKLIARTAAVAGIVLASALVAHAGDVTGKWTAEFDTQVGPQKYTFDLKVDGGKVTGKASFERMGQKGEADLKDGKLTGDDISFVEMLDFQGNEVAITYTGKIAGDEIKFTRKRGRFRHRGVRRQAREALTAAMRQNASRRGRRPSCWAPRLRASLPSSSSAWRRRRASGAPRRRRSRAAPQLDPVERAPRREAGGVRDPRRHDGQSSCGAARPDVWDSGRVASADPWATYAGPPLASRTRYYWSVRVWTRSEGPTATGRSPPGSRRPTWPRTSGAASGSRAPSARASRSAAEGEADDAAIRAAGEFCRPVALADERLRGGAHQERPGRVPRAAAGADAAQVVHARQARALGPRLLVAASPTTS